LKTRKRKKPLEKKTLRRKHAEMVATPKRRKNNQMIAPPE